MKYLYLRILLTLIVVIMMSTVCYAEKYGQPNVRLIAFGRVVDISGEAVIIGGEILVPVRKICGMFGAIVEWDEQSKKVTAIKGKISISPKYTLINGKAMADANFLEDLLNCRVEIYNDMNVITVTRKDEFLTVTQLKNDLPSYKGYSVEDLEWLARIVHAEARGEDYASKLAVANVIINRTESVIYPDTIKEVIFDSQAGVQFTPTVNGAVYNVPSNESYMAALEALEGKNNAPDTLFFINPRTAKSSWVSRNREFAFALGNHNFYY